MIMQSNLINRDNAGYMVKLSLYSYLYCILLLYTCVYFYIMFMLLNSRLVKEFKIKQMSLRYMKWIMEEEENA